MESCKSFREKKFNVDIVDDDRMLRYKLILNLFKV